MDNVTIALVVATVVVFHLLWNCWTDKSSSKKETMMSDREEYENQMSKTGQGVITRKLEAQNEQLEDLEEYDDYNSVMKYQALEPEVFESHDGYAHDIGISNSGASSLTVRSDPNDVVPWVGLRRPNYHSAYSQSDSRQVSSEYVDQMFKPTSYRILG